MNETILKILDKVTDLLKGSKRAVFAVASILLFFYLLKLNIFDIYDFETQRFVGIPAIAYIAVLGIIFGVFYFEEVLPSWLTKARMKYKTHQLRRNYLRSYLTGNQKRVLTVLLHAQSYSYFFLKTEEMDELERLDIVRSSPITKVLLSVSGQTTQYRYTIQPWAYEFLKKKLKLLETEFVFIGLKNGVAKFENREMPNTTITFYG